MEPPSQLYCILNYSFANGERREAIALDGDDEQIIMIATLHYMVKGFDEGPLMYEVDML